MIHPDQLTKNFSKIFAKRTCVSLKLVPLWVRSSLGSSRPYATAVPPFYLIRAPNGFLAAGSDALFTAKRQGVFRKRRLHLSACHRRRSWRGGKCRRVHGDRGGVFFATQAPSCGTQRCSGREPLVAMMEPADP